MRVNSNFLTTIYDDNKENIFHILVRVTTKICIFLSFIFIWVFFKINCVHAYLPDDASFVYMFFALIFDVNEKSCKIVIISDK